MLLQSTPDNSFLIILAILAGIVFAVLLVTLFFIARASKPRRNDTTRPGVAPLRQPAPESIPPRIPQAPDQNRDPARIRLGPTRLHLIPEAALVLLLILGFLIFFSGRSWLTLAGFRLLLLGGFVLFALVTLTILILRAPRANQTNPNPVQSPGSPVLTAEILSAPSQHVQESETPGNRLRTIGAIVLTAVLMLAFALAIVFLINLFMRASVPFPIRFFGAVLGVWLGGFAGARLISLQQKEVGASAALSAILLYLAFLSPIVPGENFIFLLPFVLLVMLPWIAGIHKLTGSETQTLHWLLVFLVASYVAYPGYQRMLTNFAPPLPIPEVLYWFLKGLALVSPACLAVAWLRVWKLTWLPALLMIPSMPVGLFIVEIVRRYPYIFSN